MPEGLKAKEFEIFTAFSENQLAHIYEPEEGVFIAESLKILERALAAGYEPVCALIEDKCELKVKDLLKACPEVPVYSESADTLKNLTGYTMTGGVMCAMRRKKLLKPVELIKSAKRVALLENVENPTNVGAIFRNAAALGFDAVLLTPGSSDPLYKRAVRVSMGTVFQIPWTFFDKEAYPGSAFELFKSEGFKTVAMALREDSLKIDDEKITKAEKLVVVLGSEGYGLTDETLEMCDFTVMIPMSHGVDSLNVAAASALAFWELGGKTK